MRGRLHDSTSLHRKRKHTEIKDFLLFALRWNKEEEASVTGSCSAELTAEGKVHV